MRRFPIAIWGFIASFSLSLGLVSMAGAMSSASHKAAPHIQDISADNITRTLPDQACSVPNFLSQSWPDTDFANCTIDLTEIISGGPPKDGIPPLDNPRFLPLEAVTLNAREPVISLMMNDHARAYPLSILTWHEIVNDDVGGIPVSVTYCPLCNTTIVFDRRLDGAILDFGTTGNLRHSDLIMYDRQTESFWQQYNGDAIAGTYAGARLTIIPSRLTSFAEFEASYPDGEVLAIPENFIRRYGMNPYVGYDSASFPFLFKGEVPAGIKPLERVVVVDDFALSLPYLQNQGSFRHRDYQFTWQPGQASALDSAVIAEGRDVGTVHVQRREDHGRSVDVPYKVTFAFVFHAFQPDDMIIGLTQ